MIKNNEDIEVKYDCGFKNKKIVLNKDRYIKTFMNTNLDISVIQILPSDTIEDSYFLLAEDKIDKKELVNESIYVPQYPEGESLKQTKGQIKDVNDKNEIIHLASTNHGSSGSPIFLKDSIKVLGIHKEGNIEGTENYADFIYPIFDIIKNDLKSKNLEPINNEKIKKDNENTKNLMVENMIDDGKAKIYYENGTIMYEGGLINGKFEGNGKYVYVDGDYFIGEFKNGEKNGKGIMYNKNNNIIYDGYYANDKKEGNGKLILENGEYYIGQWKNDSMDGKGKVYNKEGKLIYEGDFKNNKMEGNGSYYYETGEYYIGQYKNNLKNGKGKLFYKNNNLMYEGDFINDKKEGQGKFILETGEYYIGQFKNNLRNGKGKMYYKNGTIMYDGDYAFNQKERYGKYIFESGEYYIGQWKNDLKNGKGIIYNKDGTIM